MGSGQPTRDGRWVSGRSNATNKPGRAHYAVLVSPDGPPWQILTRCGHALTLSTLEAADGTVNACQTCRTLEGALPV